MNAEQSDTNRAGLATRERQIRRSVLLLLFFYVFVTYLSVYQPRLDPDVWWHLATGRLMASEGLPQSEPFSQYGEGRPWAAYSWLFEVILYWAYERSGLVGIVYLRIVLMLAVGGLLWDLLRRLSRQVFMAVLLTGLVLFVLLPLNTTRPWLWTVLLITVLLHLLIRFREKPRWSLLVPIPFLVILWASLHIQFVYGFILMGAFWIDQLWHGGRAETPEARAGHLQAAKWLTAAGLASGLAALVNPYGWGVYQVILVYLGQGELNHHISESSPLKFTAIWDWVVLWLALAGFLVLGWRRSREPLPYLLLIFGVLQTFRMQRDVWWLGIMAVLILAGFPERRLQGETVIGHRGLAAFVIVAVLALVWIVPPQWGVTSESLEAERRENYPVEAVEAIRAGGWPGPLYNDYNWGGYLIWALPEHKVSLDGRTPVHGSERILASLNTWAGRPSWAGDPELERARLVVSNLDVALAALLRLDPRFEIAYEDEVAVVFVRKEEPDR